MAHTLRRFTEADSVAVKDLILAVLAKEYPFDRSAYSDSDLDKIGETYGGPLETFLVADESSSIVGTAGIKEDSKECALLRRLFVDTRHRGKGYGTALINAAIEFARSKGYRKVCFRCTGRMHDAIRLCTKAGFKETEALEVGGFMIHRLELTL